MQTSTTASASSPDQQLRAQLELLKNHDADPSSTSAASSSRESGGTPTQAAPLPPPSSTSNGYDSLSIAAQDASRVLAVKHEADAHIHPDLRARPSHAPPANMMPIAAPSAPNPGPSVPGPSNPNIAPAPPTSVAMDDMPNDGRKAKRELSQSKRAAQNRAAQRAFRQRKEGYIKKLEQQVRDYMDMEQSFKTLQSENYALREYVIHLQSRLLDAQGEFPQPPPNVNLSQPPTAPPPPPGPDATSSNPGLGTPLEAVAQAVAGLAAQEQMAERQQYANAAYKSAQGQEDTRTAEEINRQLQPDEGPGQPSAV